MKAIAIPTNDRPAYLARVLSSIRACPDHRDWTLVFSCEPGSSYELAKSVDWLPIYVSRNPVRLGCRVNTFLAANFAQQIGSTLTIYLEEDVMLARDALTLAIQFGASGHPGICAFRRWESTLDPARPAHVSPAGHGLLGDGFAFRADFWPTLRKFWFYDDPSMGGAQWDWSVSWGLDKEGVPQWRPFANRSQNIGIVGTTNIGQDPNHFSPCHSGCEPAFTFTP